MTRQEGAGWIILTIALVFAAIVVVSNIVPIDRAVYFFTLSAGSGIALITLGARQEVKLREAATERYRAETERIGTPGLRERIVTGTRPEQQRRR